MMLWDDNLQIWPNLVDSGKDCEKKEESDCGKHHVGVTWLVQSAEDECEINVEKHR